MMRDPQERAEPAADEIVEVGPRDGFQGIGPFIRILIFI